MAQFTSNLRFVLNSSFQMMPKPVASVYPPSDLDPNSIGYWSDASPFSVKDVLVATGDLGYTAGVATGTASTLQFYADKDGIGDTDTGSWSLDLGTDTVNARAMHRAIMSGQGADTLFKTMLAGDDDITLSLFSDVFSGFDGDDVLLGRDGNDRLNGGDGLDQLFGENGNDSLTGGSGRDRLDGGEELDTLDGGAGRDILTGGAGRDTLTGGDGGDVFVFKQVTESGPSAGARDTITDFQVAVGTGSQFVDQIDLEAIDARGRPTGNQTFKFIGGDVFSAEGQVRAFQAGSDTRIEINTVGQSGAEMVIMLTGFNAIRLTQYDFLL